MTLMLLGIVPAGTPVPPDTPAHGAVAAGGWAGLTLSLPAGMDLAREEDTIAFARVRHDILCRYAAATDVLPVAAGVAFSDDAAVAARIARDAPLIGNGLARLGGCAEYGLAVDLRSETDGPESAGSGRDHLRLRARMRDRRGDRRDARRTFVADVASDLARLVTAHRIAAGRSAERLARIDLLVRRDRLDLCTRTIAGRLAEAAALGLHLTLTGPYPPFSFLDGVVDD